MRRLLTPIAFCLLAFSLVQCELTEMVASCLSPTSMEAVQVYEDKVLYEVYDDELGYNESDPLYLEEYGGTFYFEGDIIVGDVAEFLTPQANIRQRPACGSIGRSPRTWPEGVVPYILPPDINQRDREHLLQAMEIWSEATNVTFRPATPQDRDLLTFVYSYNDPPGMVQCSSYLGRKGGRQEIRMSYNGCGVRIFVHELGHTLGLAHEHTRCDRDEHVEILWENIMSTHRHNFNKSCRRDLPFGDYDWTSVMHYHNTAFTKNGAPTLRSKDGEIMRMTITPSIGDVTAVNYLVEISKEN